MKLKRIIELCLIIGISVTLVTISTQAVSNSTDFNDGKVLTDEAGGEWKNCKNIQSPTIFFFKRICTTCKIVPTSWSGSSTCWKSGNNTSNPN